MPHELEEVSDRDFAKEEEKFLELVEPVTWPEQPSRERMESILKRAKAEAVFADSAEFIADGFGKGLLGIIDTMVCLGTEKRPRRNY